MKKQIAIVIPARNEEKVLPGCLKQLIKVADRKDIYLVDDASTDFTAKIAKKFTKNVLSLNLNSGKALSLNKAIKHFQLTDKYHFIFPLDADTKVDKSFFKYIFEVFRTDKEVKVMAVVGHVKGSLTSAFSAYRVWEYETSQSITKKAQNYLNAIMVCSGCATVYRSEIFKKTCFSNETLTEDMDLTFTIYRKKLGKIIYTSKAIVETQDPQNLKDFKKQLDRWYSGFWQCLVKHKIPFKKQTLDLEVGWAALEGVFNGLFVSVFLILLPWLLVKWTVSVLIAVSVDLLLFTIPTVGFAAFKQRNWRIFQYIPFFYFLRIFSSLIFLKAYLLESFGLNSQVKWNKVQRFTLQGA
ncbi:glycosyltransferase family 2 protein [Candidatus Daviesbacteria bacterium]|nr:glycosyltransferase family 2 protein [Candidatus Daviesbacteria bacterium]